MLEMEVAADAGVTEERPAVNMAAAELVLALVGTAASKVMVVVMDRAAALAVASALVVACPVVM